MLPFLIIVTPSKNATYHHMLASVAYVTFDSFYTQGVQGFFVQYIRIYNEYHLTCFS